MTPLEQGVMTQAPSILAAADRLGRVPNQPKTPQRTVRVPDDVWSAAKAKADERGENLSEVIRKALQRYARRP